jgi:hypothetical protein
VVLCGFTFTVQVGGWMGEWVGGWVGGWGWKCCVTSPSQCRWVMILGVAGLCWWLMCPSVRHRELCKHVFIACSEANELWHSVTAIGYCSCSVAGSGPVLQASRHLALLPLPQKQATCRPSRTPHPHTLLTPLSLILTLFSLYRRALTQCMTSSSTWRRTT